MHVEEDGWPRQGGPNNGWTRAQANKPKSASVLFFSNLIPVHTFCGYALLRHLQHEARSAMGLGRRNWQLWSHLAWSWPAGHCHAGQRRGKGSEDSLPRAVSLRTTNPAGGVWFQRVPLYLRQRGGGGRCDGRCSDLNFKTKVILVKNVAVKARRKRLRAVKRSFEPCS